MPPLDKPSETKFHFIYIPVKDVSAMREFYTGLIGIEDASYTETENNGSLIYKFDGMHIVFYRAKQDLPQDIKWAWHYGWDGGEAEQICWSVYIEESRFADIIAKALKAEVEAHAEKPDWRMDCYWGFNVKDPMGYTVELYTQPDVRPDNAEWPG